MTLDELKAEITAALMVLAPRIRGIEDLLKVSLSAATLDQLSRARNDHVRRRDLLQVVLNSLNATESGMANLRQNGYPDVPTFAVVLDVFNELHEQLVDIEAAVSEFEIDPAVTLMVSLGAAAPKS